jgi:ABC-2 type transport system ATP-binding protein
MESHEYSIEVRNLTKKYGRITAINNVGFRVRRGERIGFLGPNGAGKSTTMRILCGLLPATSGEAWIAGHSVAFHPDLIKHKIGYMPENNPIPDDLRVGEYLTFRGKIKGLGGRRLRKRVVEVMELCDLGPKIGHRIIGSLSKGYRQRVGIADAILAEPELIIMDEPTIGLDPHQILVIRDLIANLPRSMTLLISSHILPEIELTCDRVIIINQGSIVAQGSSDELRNDLHPHLSYELRVQGKVDHIPGWVSSIIPDCHLESISPPDQEGFYLCRLKTEQSVDHSESLIRILANHPQIRLAGLSRIRPNLEDLFLAATRRNWEMHALSHLTGGNKKK